MDDHREPNRGTVLSVRGSVVDARFPGRLPDFHNELRAGDDREIVIEVVSHLDPETVRGVALTPTAGLSRGAGIIDSGHPLRVPVGERLLGRVLNVFGEAIDAGGWMHTGDLAVIDDEGYCNIVGRIKDMVIRGGENIYPREIEEFLYGHPKVLDVQVVGVPDQKYGEELCAWIIVREGESMNEEEVREYCKGQIAHYKIPRYIQFVDSFPMTVTGKIQKFLIRQKMKEALGLEDAKTA